MTYQNKDSYAGTYKNGKRHGQGYMQYRGKGIYSG